MGGVPALPRGAWAWRTALVVICGALQILAQNSTSPSFSDSSTASSILSSSLTPPTTWTILMDGYLVFHPDGSTLQAPKLDITLSFKTKRPHGLLFCHLVMPKVSEPPQDVYYDGGLTDDLQQYQFCVELYQGTLQLSHKLNQYQDVFSIGKEYHDDGWHDLAVSLDMSSGHLQVTIDGEVHSQQVRAFTWMQPTELLDPSVLSPVLRFGGASDFDQFVGCLKDLTFVGTDIHPDDSYRTKEGCEDLCVTENLCHHGSRCINLYTDIRCDCFGSDMEGKYCNSTIPTKVTLRGYEWITHQLYRRTKDRMLMDNTRISLQFKSDRGSGVLIYAVGGAPYNSHLIASVHEGTVTVSMAFGDDVIQQEMGIGMDDQRWHNLTIVHSEMDLNFLLDGVSHRHDLDYDNFHISFDPQIYFGGGDNFVTTQGLQVTQNFVGCLKNVYVNDISVLHQLVSGDTQSRLNGGTAPQEGCQPVTNIAMTFPKSGTMLLFDGYGGQDLAVELEFRTVKRDAVLLYFNLLSPGYVDTGNLEVWVRDGQPLLHYVPSLNNASHTRNTSVAMVVNDNRWHSLRLEFKAGTAKVRIGSRSVVLKGVGQPIHVSGAIIVGFVPKVYTENIGYVGCIRNLKLQNVTIDPIKLMDNRDIVDGVFLDGCNLIDHCQNGPHCQHGGKCLSDWDGIACDCDGTSYTGKTCHFPRYQRTCDDYYQAGYTRSGVYLLDVDGVGPMEPTYADCQMGHDSLDPGAPSLTGATVIEHNLVADTPIRSTEFGELKKVLSYRQMNHQTLLKLTKLSTHCHQFVKYSCVQAPVRLGELTFFRAASGQAVESIGTDQPGHCVCNRGNQCPANGCMCDRGRSTLNVDKGDNFVKSQLPITELTILNKGGGSSPGTANITLGPLRCWGSNDNKLDHAITFTAQMAHVVLDAWTSFDLRFSFRTHQQSAVILHQSPHYNNSNMFSIEMLSAQTLRFFFLINNVEFVSDIRTNLPLNTGAWQQVRVEQSRYDIHCTVATDEKIVTIPEPWVSDDPIFSGLLYLGGLPGELFEETPGLVGCVRGMVYNGAHHDLTENTDPSTPEVKPGCTASCWTNPCQNGATCVEEWGTYQCICANPWAHMGHSCEVNINEDAVSFNGLSTSFMEVETGGDLELLQSTVILSFRTTERRAFLLLYIYDSLNNFLQLEVKASGQLRLSYNHFDEIKEGILSVDGLINGAWKQVVIEYLQGGDRGVKLLLDDHQKFIPFRTIRLNKYSDRPFSSGDIRETVDPPRHAGSPDFVRLFVGGASSQMTKIPTINGCMRGLMIGQRNILLGHEARNTPGVEGACHSGCVNVPCRHGGHCWEKWGLSDYQCDCTHTAYAGKQCDIEASGTFDGQSVVEYMFRPNGPARKTTNDKLSFVFQTNMTGQEPIILVVVLSSSHTDHDYVTLWMKPDIGVYVSTSQGGLHHGLALKGQFADGKPHTLVYQHSAVVMSLKVLGHGHSDVDVEAMKTVPISNNPLQVLDTILVGGITYSSVYDNFSNRNKYKNFTGCLSVVRFEPVAGARLHLQQPLKSLRDHVNGSIVVHGHQVAPCSTPIAIGLQDTTTTTQPTTAKVHAQNLIMPPWNPGPAETIFLKPPPTPSPRTTPAPNTTTIATTLSPTPQVNLTRPRPILESRFMNDETLVIMMCIIIPVLIFAISIAFILWCKFKKRKGYHFKHKEDYEMKQPLNHTCGTSPGVSPVGSVPVSPALRDHLARLDEFSMVSATLGPSRRHENGIKPGLEPLLSQEDDQPEYTMQTFFNKKKNRPASSISEVLEEMERQRRGKDVESGKVVGTSPREEVIQQDWEPQGRSSPVNDTAEVFEGGGETEPSPVQSQESVPQQYTTDSGYEAETHPETIPPSPPKSFLDDSVELSPSPKSYLYELTGFTGNERPNCASTPHKYSTDSSDIIT